MVACYWFYRSCYCLNSNVIRMPTSIKIYLRRWAEVFIWISVHPTYRQSENKKDFPCHRDPGERDVPLSGTSFFSYKHPLKASKKFYFKEQYKKEKNVTKPNPLVRARHLIDYFQRLSLTVDSIIGYLKNKRQSTVEFLWIRIDW